ncbi:creatininase family protein [Arenibacter aquaticus]|uniref:Creatininase family protein n=1 Tax=Arenibacter aquaticus TaxID=2489054 RepID=A0A3S0D7H3_9FLAO|nr:creatininase family protein [Arenibacter aquaticus]RTE54762.1 creatininase family protein [Arenibacter aquaticus]
MSAKAQTNPLWKESKVKNYLPHMTVPEVETFLTKSDMVIIPIGALEQHSSHLPIGTDFINGVELCKLIAQERDILVAPVLLAGQSPYHMAFAGSITLSAETIVRVHMETVESLIKHGFKRFVLMNSHGGNTAVTTFLVDQINQKTSAVAVDYSVAIKPFLEAAEKKEAKALDRHAGTGETSNSMYLMPSLVQLEKATATKLTLPEHLEKMVPDVIKEEPTAKLLFLAEGLKAEETGKKTSTIEMTKTGVWGELDPKEATLERGEDDTKRMISACSKFIDRWNELVKI